MSERKYIQHYHSTTPGSVPAAEDLLVGEIAINAADEKIFFKNNDEIVTIASNSIQKVTYQELRYLYDNNKLVPGKRYEITDYEASTNPDYVTVSYELNTTYNILVTAITPGTLESEARLVYKSTGEVDENFVITYSIDVPDNEMGWFVDDMVNGYGIDRTKTIIMLQANNDALFQTNVEVVINEQTYYLWDSISDTKYLSTVKNPVDVNDTLLSIYDEDTDTISGTCSWTNWIICDAFGPTYKYSGGNQRYLFVPRGSQVGNIAIELNLSDDYMFGVYNASVEITSMYNNKGCITYMKYLPTNVSCNYDFLHILMKSVKSNYPDVFRHTFSWINSSNDDGNHYALSYNITNEGYYNFIKQCYNVKIQGSYNVLLNVENSEILESWDNDISGTRLIVYQCEGNLIRGDQNTLRYVVDCSISTSSVDNVIQYAQGCTLTGQATANELMHCSACTINNSSNNKLHNCSDIQLMSKCDSNYFYGCTNIYVPVRSNGNTFTTSLDIGAKTDSNVSGWTGNVFENCNSITLGDACNYNVFNTGSNHIVLDKNSSYNVFGEGCYNIHFTASTPNISNTFSDKSVSNITFANGISNCVFYAAGNDYEQPIKNYYVKNASNVIVNILVYDQDYLLTVAKNSSGEVKIYNEADLIA